MYVTWYDGFGNPHQTLIIGKYSHHYPEIGVRSWVATWHPKMGEPIWIDIRDIVSIDEEPNS